MKKWAWLFPLLVIFAGLLLLYARAVVGVAPRHLVRPMFVLIMFFGLLAHLLNRLVADWELTSIFLGILILALLFQSVTLAVVAGSLVLVFLIWSAYTLGLKRPGGLPLLVQMLCATMGLFVAAELYVLSGWFRQLGPMDYAPQVPAKPDIVLAPAVSRPDIYFILVDGYGRADILRDYYAFDNSAFIQYLESRGFVVAGDAHSNYAKSVLSIGSSLNLDYIDEWAPNLVDSPVWWTLVPYVERSRLRAALERQGYQTYATASDWSITDNRTVDHYYQPYALGLTEFEGFFLSSTLIGRMAKPLEPLGEIGSYASHRAFIDNNFTSLEAISKMDGPKFVFAHIIAPHPPFVFAADGSPVTPSRPFGFADGSDYREGRDQYQRLYVGQLQYVNSRLEEVVDVILANSSGPPIILLQADHGPGMLTDFLSASDTCVHERFSILAAYKLPGIDSDVVPSDITPVNLFRIVLRQYFDARLPLLENRSYYSGNPLQIMQTVDVTDRADLGCAGLTEP